MFSWDPLLQPVVVEGRTPISEVLLSHPRYRVESVPGDRLAKGWPSPRVRTGRPEQERVIWWRWT